MNVFDLKPHPFSQIFPDQTGTEFSELVASVKKLGRIRNSVIIYQGKILDGRHRLRACKIAKVVPKTIVFEGTDQQALDLVWDQNANRRNINTSQRAASFALYCNFLDHGQRANGAESGHVTTLDEAAEKADVAKSTMQRAKKVVEHGTKKQIKAVIEGKTTVTEAAREIAAKTTAQNGQVDDLGYSVPKPALSYWSRRPEAKNVVAQIKAAKGQVKKLDAQDPMWAEVNLNGVLSDLESAINRMRGAVPAYVCVYCQGVTPDGCTVCKGRGVVSEFMWKVAVPDELKQMRPKL
jgi:rubrerythrin